MASQKYRYWLIIILKINIFIKHKHLTIYLYEKHFLFIFSVLKIFLLIYFIIFLLYVIFLEIFSAILSSY